MNKKEIILELLYPDLRDKLVFLENKNLNELYSYIYNMYTQKQIKDKTYYKIEEIINKI